jgi:hypothetical protein
MNYEISSDVRKGLRENFRVSRIFEEYFTSQRLLIWKKAVTGSHSA